MGWVSDMGGQEGVADSLEAEPRALQRRMGAVLGASAAILVMIAFTDFVVTRWAEALAAREAQVAALLLEQQALAGQVLQAGASGDAASRALRRFAANRHALSEGDAARGLVRPGTNEVAAILFRAPHHLAQAMAEFERAPGADPAATRAMMGALAMAHERQSAGAAGIDRLRDRLDAAFAVAFLVSLAGIMLGLVRPMVLSVVSQMRRLIAAHDAVQHAAFHDPATGLPNRDSLMLQLDLALGDPGLDGQILGLVEVQLMRFEHETGALDHDAGQAALRECAARLAAMRQGDDIVARLDGAAFAAVFTDVLDDAELEKRARQVAARLSEPVVVGGRSLDLGATVGAAAATGGRMLAAQAAGAARQAIARARRAGAGNVEVLGSSMVRSLVSAPDAIAPENDRAARRSARWRRAG